MPLSFSNTEFTKDGFVLSGLTDVTANIEVRLPQEGLDVICGLHPSTPGLDNFQNVEFELSTIDSNILGITVQQIYNELINQLETRNPTWTGKISIV